MEGKWTTEKAKRIGSTAFLHLTYKKDTTRRSVLQIIEEDDTNGEVKTSSLLLCIPSASSVFHVVVRRDTVQLLQVALLL